MAVLDPEVITQVTLGGVTSRWLFTCQSWKSRQGRVMCSQVSCSQFTVSADTGLRGYRALQFLRSHQSVHLLNAESLRGSGGFSCYKHKAYPWHSARFLMVRGLALTQEWQVAPTDHSSWGHWGRIATSFRLGWVTEWVICFCLSSCKIFVCFCFLWVVVKTYSGYWFLVRYMVFKHILVLSWVDAFTSQLFPSSIFIFPCALVSHVEQFR